MAFVRKKGTNNKLPHKMKTKQLDWVEIINSCRAQKKYSKAYISSICDYWNKKYGKSYISLYSDEMLRANQSKTKKTNME